MRLSNGTNSFGNLIQGVPQFVVLGVEHPVQGIKYWIRHIPLKSMGLIMFCSVSRQLDLNQESSSWM